VNEDDLLIRSRSALLDVLEALDAHRESVIVVGAQAVYLRTANAHVALAEATKDCDLAFDPRHLDDEPLIEDAMAAAGFFRGPTDQPGAWVNSEGIPVDLMVPEELAGDAKRSSRGARIPPHDVHATRRTRGLEAAAIDNDVMEVGALDPSDGRRRNVLVAGSAALLVAKVHKIADRSEMSPNRLVDKDAHDIYRILIAWDTHQLAAKFRLLLDDGVSKSATKQAVEGLADLFAVGPEALGSVMAGRAEDGIGEPATVALQTSILAADLLTAIDATE
jgi:hypothetical protein